MSNPKLTTYDFDSTTTNWICPGPVGEGQLAIVSGWGGGGGGGGAASNSGGLGGAGGGGGGSLQGTVFCQLIGGSAYNITIGAGGASGVGGVSSGDGSSGGNGGNTMLAIVTGTFPFHSTVTQFAGASGGQKGFHNVYESPPQQLLPSPLETDWSGVTFSSYGGASITSQSGNPIFVNFNDSITAASGSFTIACGGSGGIPGTGTAPSAGADGVLNITGNTSAGGGGSTGTGGSGGGGGGAGPGFANTVGNGGAGVSSGSSNAGLSPTANSGCGGGGGGFGGATGGAGGVGGSGFLSITILM